VARRFSPYLHPRAITKPGLRYDAFLNRRCCGHWLRGFNFWRRGLAEARISPQKVDQFGFPVQKLLVEGLGEDRSRSLNLQPFSIGTKLNACVAQRAE
jgi:hypothetical protein